MTRKVCSQPEMCSEQAQIRLQQESVNVYFSIRQRELYRWSKAWNLHTVQLFLSLIAIYRIGQVNAFFCKAFVLLCHL